MFERPSTSAIRILLFSALTGATVVTSAQTPTSQPPSPVDKARIAANYGKLPLSFEANEGQTDRRVRFLSRGNGYSLFLTDSAAVLTLSKGAGTRPEEMMAPRGAGAAPISSTVSATGTDVIRMELAGTRRAAEVAGEDQLPGIANYFLGNDPAKWHSNVPTYAKVQYKGVYPGVDLVYYGNQRQLEYDFVVAPGADPRTIQLRFAGARNLRLTREGDLQVIAKNGEITFQKPVVYQTVNGSRKPVEGSFAVAANKTVSFSLGQYDRSAPLVIDPTLGYSTYLGGTGNGTDVGYAIAVDSSGSAYVVGETTSSSFPVTSGALQRTFSGNPAVFITKLSANGGSLLYSTYLSGNDALDNHGRGIKVDSSGNAYVVGYTRSPDFPTTSRAYQPKDGGNYDAFVTKLNATGSELVYSTYFGGFYSEYGEDIAIDASGNAFITGWANTIAGNFPVTPGAFQTSTKDVNGNAFIARFSADGSELSYSTLLGGSGSTNTSLPASGGDYANSIAVDAEDNAYVTGVAGSTNFPTTSGAFQITNNTKTKPACDNAFVTKINSKGTELIYSTYLGGGGSYDSAHSLLYCDTGSSISLDSAGNVYVGGTTGSTDFPFTKGAYLTTNPEVAEGGHSTGFVTKLNPTGTGLVYSTYLGGSDGSADAVNGVAVDNAGDAFLTGFTSSESFPVSAGAFQSTNPGADNLAQAAFVTELNPAGSALLYSTYFGGDDGDFANAIALDGSGNPYFTGQTCSNDFPTSTGAYQTTNNEAKCTAFVAKLNFNPIPVPTPTTTGLACSPSPQIFGEPVTCTATVVGTGTKTVPTGSVVFTIDGTAEPAVTLNSAGGASYAASVLAVGAHTVIANYGGSAAFASSVSKTVAETVNPAAPVFSPAAGTYTKPMTVTLTDSDKNATIYYTTSGTAPTTSSSKYTGPIAISKTTTIEAIAVDKTFESGVASATYAIEGITATPVITPVAGTYEEVQTVTITDADAAATIYFTTTGATPSATSTKYTGPITVSVSETIKAIAVGPGDAPSAVATAVYVIVGSPTALAAPASAVEATSATLNGVVNTHGLVGSYSFRYGTSSAALTATTAKTALSASAAAVAASAKLASLKASTTYFFQVVVTTAGGTSSGAIVSFTTGAAQASLAGNGPGNGSAGTGENDAVPTPLEPEVKRVVLPTATPSFSPGAGTYSTAQSVTLHDSTPGAVFYYTLNGTTPTTGSTRYTGPITIASTSTLKVIALAPNYDESVVASGVYIIN